MTKIEVLALVEEMRIEEKKTKRIPHYYMRGGKVLERSYPDYEYTERYEELFHNILRSKEAMVFKCACCGKNVGYFDLEEWECEFEDNYYICSTCYEDEMGEDL